jgi:hypothetical protein
VSQCKIIFRCILGRWNFREIIRFFQKALNPLKIQGTFNFEFILEFITSNPEGILRCVKKKVVPYVSKCLCAQFGEF